MNVLAQLRDIHLPDPISFWPLAMGWYLLFILFIFFVGMMMYWGYQQWQKLHRRKFIFGELQRLQTQWLMAQSAMTITELSILLKRVALAVYPRHEVAGLTGEAWLQFLDKTAGADHFTRGEGRLLLTAPYQKQGVVVTDRLFLFVRQWMERVL